MPSRKSSPSFDDYTLAIGPSSWLHHSRWLEADFTWYKSQNKGGVLQVTRAPQITHRRLLPRSDTEALWLLRGEDQEDRKAWAQLQIFSGPRYRTGYLFYGSIETLDREPELTEAMATLIGLSLLVGRLDLIRLWSSSPLSTPSWAASAGEPKAVFTFPRYPWVPGSQVLVPQGTLDISRESWETCASMQPFKRHLTHVESRLQRFAAAEEKMKDTKRKRGLIARVFRPRIDDAIF